METNSLLILRGRCQKPDTKQSTQSVDNDKYKCPCFNERFTVLDEFGDHVVSTHLIKRANNNEKELLVVDSDDEDEAVQNKPITVPTALTVVNCESSVVVQINQKNKRPYEDAILYACQKTRSDTDTKKQTLYIVDTLHLKPYSMKNERGEEVNLLAHPAAVSPSMSSISHTIPSKRQYFGIDTIMNKFGHCMTNYPLALEAVILQSPYKTLLYTRSFVELSEDLCDLLNTDWRIYGNMKQVTARLLAGRIYINHANGNLLC